jgi:hypothetical protein
MSAIKHRFTRPVTNRVATTQADGSIVTTESVLDEEVIVEGIEFGADTDLPVGLLSQEDLDRLARTEPIVSIIIYTKDGTAQTHEGGDFRSWMKAILDGGGYAGFKTPRISSTMSANAVKNGGVAVGDIVRYAVLQKDNVVITAQGAKEELVKSDKGVPLRLVEANKAGQKYLKYLQSGSVMVLLTYEPNSSLDKHFSQSGLQDLRVKNAQANADIMLNMFQKAQAMGLSGDAFGALASLLKQ